MNMQAELFKPIRNLTCCCCGAMTTGRQHYNRDAGYGLCVNCIELCHRNVTDEDMQSCYGLRGVHYDLTLPPGIKPMRVAQHDTRDGERFTVEQVGAYLFDVTQGGRVVKSFHAPTGDPWPAVAHMRDLAHEHEHEIELESHTVIAFGNGVGNW